MNSNTEINASQLWGDVFNNRYHCAAHIKNKQINQEFDFPCYFMKQTHSNKIVLIESIGSESLVTFDSQTLRLEKVDVNYQDSNYVVESDALITDQRELGLAVKTADCLPIYIAGGKYISVIHAGRVGTLASITKKVCLSFKYLGVEEVKVWFGPSSCVFCYEIDEDTNTHFDMLYSNKFQIESVFPIKNVQYHMPKKEYVCTQCNTDTFYSYRFGDDSLRNYFYLANL